MKLAKEAWPILVVALAAAVGLVLIDLRLALIPALFALFTAWFFRDPERRTPQVLGSLICPADGKIIRADSRGISVFMNVFNVHVCRSPIAGTVRSVSHEAGRFLSAFKTEAPEVNERVRIVLDGDAGPVAFTLIAGLIARRIVCKISPGDRLAAGQRVGLIQFGSRVDVEVPDRAELAVRVGDRVVAGETILLRTDAAKSL